MRGGVAREGSLSQRRARAEALRGRLRGALAAAGVALRVPDVAHAQVRQAGGLQDERRAPPLGRTGDGVPRGCRRDGRLRRHGRRARRRGRGGLRVRGCRRAHRLGRPAPAAEVAVRPPGRLAGQRGARGAAGRARRVPRLRAAVGSAGRPAHNPRRGSEARPGGGRGGRLRSPEATGGVDAATLELSVAVSASGDGRVVYDEPVDLTGYDRALGLLEGGAASA